MSNYLAIATVTAALQHLLERIGNTEGDPELVGTKVTALPPHLARRENDDFNQINIFLYQTTINGAWRNQTLPSRVKPGETGQPPIALNLHYIITAYGSAKSDILSQRLLGRAVSILNDHPILSSEEIKTALPGNDLFLQPEGIRITQKDLSSDDIFKIWSSFQTQYRLSAAYEVAVVLIESNRPVRTPLPVLTRGPEDKGAVAQPDLATPLPIIEKVTSPNGRFAALLGDTLAISGRNLSGDTVRVRFTHLRLEKPIIIDSSLSEEARVEVQIPDQPHNWPSGMYTFTVEIQRAGESDRTTNELPIPVAPKILGVVVGGNALPLPIGLQRDADGNLSVVVSCTPLVLPEQRASLLLGDQEFIAKPRLGKTSSLTFDMKPAPLGEHLVRLRVDGIDSQIIDYTARPPVFDKTQKVTIHD